MFKVGWDCPRRGAVLLSAVAAFIPLSHAQDAGLDEVVVTARKVEERLQDVPLSISAFGSQQIERQGITRLEDVAKLVPGLDFDLGAFPNDTRPAIRGMQNERGRPSVAVLLDGQDIGGENLYIAGGTGSLNARLLDLERIEVVKGPQSVLYGRSAFSGAVNYISKKPSMEAWGGRVELEGGTGNTRGARASLTGPVISEKLAVRFNVSSFERDGFYDNPVTGEDLGAERSLGGALSVLFKPTEKLSVLARYQYADDEFSQLAGAYIGANTTVAIPGGTFAPFPGGPQSPCPTDLTGATPTVFAACTRQTVIGGIAAAESDIQISASPFGGTFPGLDQTQENGTLEATLNTFAGDFTLMFGYLRNDAHSIIDGDYNDYPVGPTVVSFSAAVNELYENSHRNWEVRWSNAFGPVDVIVGAQLFKETSSLISGSQFWLRNPASIFGGPPFFFRAAPTAAPPFPGFYARSTEYQGAFGSLQWQINDRARLAIEGRYNDDELDYYTDGFTRLQVGLQGLTPSCPPTPGGASSCGDRASLSESKFTPRVSLDYKFRDGLMAYATYAQGYKPGGYNVNEVTDLSQQGYLSESVDTYEVGVKTDWLDRRLLLNAAAFFNDYTDQQVGIQRIDDQTGQTLSAIANAGAVEIKGLEVEAVWRATQQLSVNAFYALTDGDYTEFVIGPLATALQRVEAGNVTGDFSGNAVQKTAKHAFNVGIDYRDALSNGMKWFAEGNVSYRSERFLDEANLQTMPSYALVDLRAGLSGERWALTAFVNNVFDDDKIKNAARFVDVGRTEGFGAPGRAVLAYLPLPRVVGLRLELTF
ncbi:MAG: TonB-dependent receptor [Steroidobacteraceae bacterium]